MSAFMCDDDCFAELARFLRRQRPDLFEIKYADLGIDPVTFAECLRAINRESIMEKYPDTRKGPEHGGMLEAAPLPPIDPASVDECTPAQAAMHLRCIAYQSCETPRWRALSDFVAALARDIYPAIDASPRNTECNEAAWGHRNVPKAPPEPEPEPEPRAYVRTVDRAKQIRETIKAAGVARRLVSVVTDSYSMGSSIHVRIKSLDVPFSVVNDAANQHETVRRDDFGDILSGGNTYVFVDVEVDIIRAVADALVPDEHGVRRYAGCTIHPVDGGETFHVPEIKYYGVVHSVRAAVLEIYKAGTTRREPEALCTT